jgi:hypothetical protein
MGEFSEQSILDALIALCLDRMRGKITWPQFKEGLASVIRKPGVSCHHDATLSWCRYYAHPDEFCRNLAEAETALLPCPFCGGEAIFLFAEQGKRFWVECRGHCPTWPHTPRYDIFQEAAAAWNKRKA